MNKDLHSALKALGNSDGTQYAYDAPDSRLLEKFSSPFAAAERNPNAVAGALSISVPEFTSLCPLTGQPDFATIKINYVPDQWCVESKALKLYLGSFRNTGEFHEACICRMCNDLVELLQPKSIQVVGEFTPRGGIPFWPEATFIKALDTE